MGLGSCAHVRRAQGALWARGELVWARVCYRRRMPWQTVNDALAENGFHTLSPWWREVCATVEAARPRVVVPRVGRRGGKTTTALRWLLAELLGRTWHIDSADVGVCPIISAHRWQALELNTPQRVGPQTKKGPPCIEHDRPVLYIITTLPRLPTSSAYPPALRRLVVDFLRLCLR